MSATKTVMWDRWFQITVFFLDNMKKPTGKGVSKVLKEGKRISVVSQVEPEKYADITALGEAVARPDGYFSVSAVMKQLVPSINITEALAEISKQDKTIDCIGALFGTFAKHIQGIMAAPGPHCIDAHVRHILKTTECCDVIDIISNTFVKWQRACNKVAGYNIEKIEVVELGKTLASQVVYCDNPKDKNFDKPTNIELISAGVREILRADLAKMESVLRQLSIKKTA